MIQFFSPLLTEVGAYLTKKKRMFTIHELRVPAQALSKCLVCRILISETPTKTSFLPVVAFPGGFRAMKQNNLEQDDLAF